MGKNPAAPVLEARWRLANADHKKVSNLAALLDSQHPLTLTNEEMDSLGGEEKG